ncbi:TRY3 [Symbiodinium necroappetens]|uniref:E3 ubiquitin-protein ligase CHFR n=1 Tax=Symbiodinium necroappetens TaxID=1628268 RepID=A0A813CDC5_9DINO|nr:TRY3 [Symbiodinium necroappetens]
MFASRRQRRCEAEQRPPRPRPQYGAAAKAANLPALSICRLESPEEILKKLRQHAEDPAMAEFTCPICWEPFWQPVRTVCGHAFCEGCLLKSVLAQLGYDQPDVSCPMCRHPLHVEDVAADEALLARIRLVVAQKARESESQSKGHPGRLYRGSTRSPIAEQTPSNPRSLHCTGQPCTPALLEWPARAQSSGAHRTQFPGSWMRVAPSDSRPATSGCVVASHKSAFWSQSFSARPSTSGVSEVWGDRSEAQEETVATPLWPTWPAPARLQANLVGEVSEGDRDRSDRDKGGAVSDRLHSLAKPQTPRTALHKQRPRSQPSKQGRPSRMLPHPPELPTYRAPLSSRGPRPKRTQNHSQTAVIDCSTNGTFLNGLRLPPRTTGKVLVSHGDELLLQDPANDQEFGYVVNIQELNVREQTKLQAPRRLLSTEESSTMGRDFH